VGEQRRQEPDRRREILEAALRVFSERGFRGATIKEIAREAGIRSSALIYWYFEDKDDLFRAILTEFLPVVRRVADTAELMDRPPEEVLQLIAGIFLDTFDDPTTVRLFRVTLSAAAASPGEIGQALEKAQREVLGFVTTYLQRQVDLGRLRLHDPQSAARSFVGMLIVYVLSREVFLHLRDGLPDKEQYVKNVVGIFLDGLRER
jgi:TetR/AcrR family transcriptional regulator